MCRSLGLTGSTLGGHTGGVWVDVQLEGAAYVSGACDQAGRVDLREIGEQVSFEFGEGFVGEHGLVETFVE